MTLISSNVNAVRVGMECGFCFCLHPNKLLIITENFYDRDHFVQ